MIHIQGMGLLGCFLAQELHHHGVPFTWYDATSMLQGKNPPGTQAWRASTGCIYPSSEPQEEQAYNLWDQSWRHRSWSYPHLEEALWWFNGKVLPHTNGEYRVVQSVNGINRTNKNSLHWNSQAFVTATRDRFRSLERVQSYPSADPVVVAHGFDLGPLKPETYYAWGWSAQVELSFSPALGALTFGGTFRGRPAFYLRNGRFVWAYAYPRPGTQFWYAGTSMINQKPGKAKELEVPSKFAKWVQTFSQLSGGHVQISNVWPETAQGWRPYGADENAPLVAPFPLAGVARALRVKPMGASGVRLAPLVVQALFKGLGLEWKP